MVVSMKTTATADRLLYTGMNSNILGIGMLKVKYRGCLLILLASNEIFLSLKYTVFSLPQS